MNRADTPRQPSQAQLKRRAERMLRRARKYPSQVRAELYLANARRTVTPAPRLNRRARRALGARA